MKKNTAAGTDNIRKSHLGREGAVRVLAKIFNTILLKEHYPSTWKRNRTTLIPKQGKDASDVKNWRPITIGSILSRIFSGIVDRRIRQHIDFAPRQKGFTAAD